MGAIRDKLNKMQPGQSFSFPQSKLFLVRAELKEEPPNKFLVRRDPTKQDDWRIWRNKDVG